MTAPRVAVIGGGLAGLAAAVQLRRRGALPVVFEQGGDVGGVVRTVDRDGWIVDAGAAMAAEPAPLVRELLDAAGVASIMVRANPVGTARYIVLHGAPVILPRTTSEFSSSSLLSIGGRLRLLKERLIPPRNDDPEESVESFARRRFGDEMAERMFDPLIASTCAGDPRRIIARFAFPAVVGHERKAGSSLQGSARARMEARRRARGAPTASWSCGQGMQQLPRQLASWLGSVRTDAAVRAVRANSPGFDVATASGPADRFDAVLFAVPAAALGSMAIDLPGAGGLARVASMPHASIASVSLGFRHGQVAHPLDASRLLVPSIEQRAILSMVFPSSVFPDRAPAGHHLITAFAGGALRPELLDLADGDLVATVAGEAAELLGIQDDPVLQQVTRWHGALPQAVAGHAERLAAADAIEAASPQVAFAGAWRDGLAIGEVLLGAMKGADRLLERGGWGVA